MARKLQFGPSKLNERDLMQAGAMGIVTAAQKFDPEKGFAFITYAHFWIFKDMTRDLKRFGSPVSYPINNTREKDRLRFISLEQITQET